MLIKLFKHEFKTTGKLLLPLNLALIGVTILGMIMLAVGAFDGDSFITSMMTVAAILLYCVALIALSIICQVYLMVRFYRSMYSDEGYLTHTLPVSSWKIFNTKLTVSVFWTFLSVLLTIVSILALVSVGVNRIAGPVTETWADIMAEFETVFGMSMGAFIGWGLLYLLISCLSGMLIIFCSISIGQLFNKHKVAAAIITYVIFYIIMQIASTIISIWQSVGTYTTALTSSELYIYEESATFTDLFGGLFSSSMILSLVFVIICYIANVYISSKKLNLD